MTNEQSSATNPSHTADGTLRAIARRPAPLGKYPSSYACFGASTNASALPWRTTKEGVEWESPVYQFALGKMRMLARPVQIYLRDSYEEPLEAASHREVLESAKGVSLFTIGKSKDTVFTVDLPKKRETVDVSIQYSRPRSQVKKIAAALKKPKLSGSKVGEYTFDYYLENMCK